MSRYIKYHSNYVLKKFHQLTNDGKIFERDWVTVGSAGKNTPGQNPIYYNSNFIFTSRNSINYRKKYHFGKWVVNNDNEESWTIDDVSDNNDKSSNLEINNESNDLRDYAYFGSCIELIRSSVEDIIKYFPAEIFFSEIPYMSYDKNIDDFKTIGNIVQNDYNIDMASPKSYFEDGDNKMRYFMAKYDDESYVYQKYVIINNDNEEEITDVSVERFENLECKDFFNDAIITINGKYTIYRYTNVNNVIYIHNSNNGIRIRPSQDIINDFFNNLDSFESKLLNLKSNPKYSNSFLTPIETNKGVSFVYRTYTWPCVNDYNLDISSLNYELFINNLLSVAQYFDDNYSDNIYRAMTHESIKNFDWTYTREHYDGESEKYIEGGTKIANLLRVYGRILDDIKRYIDNIKFTNTITYNGNNNVPDYFITDKLEDYGWVVTDILKPSTENNSTERIYLGIIDGYKYYDIRNQFYKRLLLCSKRILQSKGTENSIRMIFSMFGIGEDEYEIYEEYYLVKNPITGNDINEIKDKNQDKEYEIEYDDDEFSGIMAKEYTFDNIKYLYPYFDSSKNYDGNPYFQLYGGWCKKIETNRYEETMSYLNMVNNVSDLFNIELIKIKEGDIYYVSNLSEYYEIYGNDTKEPTNYFKLINIDNYRNKSGWENIQDDDPDVEYLNSIINNNNGNNPHVGYGEYDGGDEFFKYVKNLFYASDTVEEVGFSIDKKNTLLNITDSSSNEDYEDYKILTGKTSHECLSYLNSKVVKIKLLPDKVNDVSYISEYILPYIKQLLPSTVIVELEGFVKDGEEYIYTSQNNILLNNSCDNTIDSFNITVNSSDNNNLIVSNNSNGIVSNVSINGNILTVTLSDNPSSNSGEINLKIGETKSTINVYYHKLEISSNNITEDFRYDSMSDEIQKQSVSFNTEINGDFSIVSKPSWCFIEKNGNEIIVSCVNNYSLSQRSGFIRVENSNDSNCFCLIEISQKSLGMSIQSSKIYEYKLDEDMNPTNEKIYYDNIGYEGGKYYIDVDVSGGEEDFTIEGVYCVNNCDSDEYLTDCDNIVTASKINSKLVLLSIDKNLSDEESCYKIIFKHVNADNCSDSEFYCDETCFCVEKGLSVKIGGETSVDVVVNSNTICIDDIVADGGSGEWFVCYNDDEYHVSYSETSSTDNKACFDIINYNDFNSATIRICHKDDNDVYATVNLTKDIETDCKIEISPSSVSLDANGGEKVIVAKVYGKERNISVVSSIPEFVEIEYNKVSEMSNYTIYNIIVTVDKNITQNERNAEILIENSYCPDSGQATISINQSFNEEYSICAKYNDECTPTISNVKPEGETITLTVDIYPENSPYIANSTSDWVTISNGDSLTPKLIISKNEYEISRSCKVNFIHGLDSSVTDVVTINQESSVGLSLLVSQNNKDFYDEITIEVENGVKSSSFYIKSQGGDYSFKTGTYPSWISNIEPVSGNAENSIRVTFNLSDNTNVNDRSGDIILYHNSNNDISAIVHVIQKYALGISIAPNDGGSNENTYTINAPDNGGIYEFTITPVGGSYSYKYCSENYDGWLTANNESLNEINNYTTNKISLKVGQNSDGRNAKLEFSHQDVNCGEGVSVFVNIIQASQNYSITVDEMQTVNYETEDALSIEKEFTVQVYGGSQRFIVKEVSCDWISVSSTDNSVKLSIEENIEEIIRECKVILQHADKEGVEAIINVTQKEALVEYGECHFEINPSELSFNSDGGSNSVTVKSYVDKYVNGKQVSNEDIPYYITYMDYILTINENEKDFTIEVPYSGGNIPLDIVSKVVKYTPKTGEETEENVINKVTNSNDWFRIDKDQLVVEGNSAGNRQGTFTCSQISSYGKSMIITVVQNLNEESVIWSEPSEGEIVNVEQTGSTIIAYADTTALTYDQVEVNKSPDEDWVTVNSIEKGDNDTGQKSVKVNITINPNENDEEREISLEINKKNV